MHTPIFINSIVSLFFLKFPAFFSYYFLSVCGTLIPVGSVWASQCHGYEFQETLSLDHLVLPLVGGGLGYLGPVGTARASRLGLLVMGVRQEDGSPFRLCCCYSRSGTCLPQVYIRDPLLALFCIRLLLSQVCSRTPLKLLLLSFIWLNSILERLRSRYIV